MADARDPGGSGQGEDPLLTDVSHFLEETKPVSEGTQGILSFVHTDSKDEPTTDHDETPAEYDETLAEYDEKYDETLAEYDRSGGSEESGGHDSHDESEGTKGILPPVPESDQAKHASQESGEEPVETERILPTVSQQGQVEDDGMKDDVKDDETNDGNHDNVKNDGDKYDDGNDGKGLE